MWVWILALGGALALTAGKKRGRAKYLTTRRICPSLESVTVHVPGFGPQTIVMPPKDVEIYPLAHQQRLPAPFECSPVSTQMNLVRGFWRDEFNRPYRGVGLFANLRNALGDMTSSPLWQIAKTGAWLLPGGYTVSAAMALIEAVGREESLGDAALRAARSQLSPEQQLVWDVGVGAARGNLDTVRVRQHVQQVFGSRLVEAFDAGAQEALKG